MGQAHAMLADLGVAQVDSIMEQKETTVVAAVRFGAGFLLYPHA